MPASLGFGLATPLPPSAAQAEPGPDPTRVGARPDPGLARRGFAAPSARLRPSNLGRLWAGTQTSGLPARHGLRPAGVAAPHTSGPSARPVIRPVGGGCALPYVARPLPGHTFAAWPRLRAREGAGVGPDPTRVGSRPGDLGFARQGGSAARGYPPALGDTGRAAVGRAGSFNSGKNATVPSLEKARRA